MLEVFYFKEGTILDCIIFAIIREYKVLQFQIICELLLWHCNNDCQRLIPTSNSLQ